MRAVVRTAVIEDAELISLGVAPERCLAGDVDSPQIVSGQPVLVFKWGTTNPGINTASTLTTLVIWVYDAVGNGYTLIDRICRRLRVVVGGLEGVTDDVTLDYVSQASWSGDGPDLQDDAQRAVLRQSNYLLNGSTP